MKSARQLAVEILKNWEESNNHVNAILDAELKRSHLPVRDRNLVNELVNGTMRWRGRLDYIIHQFYHGKFSSIPSLPRIILEISLYQLMFTTRIPAYAALNEAVDIGRNRSGESWAKKINAILRSYLRSKDKVEYPDITLNPAEHIAAKYSHPQWLVKRWIGLYGINSTRDLCRANNATPSLSIRVNKIRITAEKVKQLFTDNEIDWNESKYLPEFIRADKLPALNEYDVFLQGLISIQDESAGLVSRLVNPKPGQIIVDLCAAPGGKSTHIAEIAADNVTVIAVDNNENRIKHIQEYSDRLGLKSVQSKLADASTFEHHPVDAVLADVPCSGLGVLAKRSDLRWKRTEAQVQAIRSTQKTILENASSLVKHGGTLVYSTCTIEPDENERIVEDFMSRHKEFILEDPADFVDASIVVKKRYVYTYPHIHGIDGSFCARLKKIN